MPIKRCSKCGVGFLVFCAMCLAFDAKPTFPFDSFKPQLHSQRMIQSTDSDTRTTWMDDDGRIEET